MSFLFYIYLKKTKLLLIFLNFNFPKAKIFLGDSGSYFLGAFIAISTIETSIANPTISPFYFCILMFYLLTCVFLQRNLYLFYNEVAGMMRAHATPRIPPKPHRAGLANESAFQNSRSLCG